MIQKEEAISLSQFVDALLRHAEIVPIDHDGLHYGYCKGWLQEQDVTGDNLPLQKKHCARIVHDFIRIEKSEHDEIDSGPAGNLQDLFDCRVCAGHVMQVYAKGIMDGYRNNDGRYIFGMEDGVSEVLAEQILHRVFCPKSRVIHKREDNMQAKCISFQEASLLLQATSDILLVDVRPEAEYQERHLKRARNIPMMNILKNPYTVSERRDIRILVYCEQGYMSETAAQSLVRAGYGDVSYFAWNCN